MSPRPPKTLVLDEALALFGHRQKDLADALGVTEAAVSQWRRRGAIPALRLYQIEALLHDPQAPAATADAA